MKLRTLTSRRSTERRDIVFNCIHHLLQSLYSGTIPRAHVAVLGKVCSVLFLCFYGDHSFVLFGEVEQHCGVDELEHCTWLWDKQMNAAQKLRVRHRGQRVCVAALHPPSFVLAFPWRFQPCRKAPVTVWTRQWPRYREEGERGRERQKGGRVRDEAEERETLRKRQMSRGDQDFNMFFRSEILAHCLDAECKLVASGTVVLCWCLSRSLSGNVSK